MVLYVLSGIVNYIVLSPILITFLAVVFSVSSVGKAFGLRRLYVNFLLRIFEVRRRLHLIESHFMGSWFLPEGF